MPIPLDDGTSVSMPIVPVELQKTQNGEIMSATVMALIDSGSMYNIFNADIAKLLGIDNLKSAPSINIGGIAPGDDGNSKQIKGYKHSMGIVIQGKVRNTDIYFSPDISVNAFNMLGQVGFFDKFQSIKLDYRRSKITIQT